MAKDIQYQTITVDSHGELTTKLHDQTEKGWRAIRVTVRQVGYAIDLELRAPVQFFGQTRQTKIEPTKATRPTNP